MPNDLVLYFEWITKRVRRISSDTFTGLLPQKKRFHKTVEALAKLFLFMAALIKLMKFLISPYRNHSHMRLTPVTNTYPVYHCFSLSGFICEQTCLFIDRSTVPSICHLPLSNNSQNQKRNENRIQTKQISIHLRV